ncbi:hypothetical protein IG197_27415 [Aminobacter sp. SR38]|jgi:hypothetical protein|uniref:hypothetical protein n=1 Tax=Aminobacter sp. SR38 TaxID=2774562 RepID=UPI00177E7DC8|nr:hypothetical protein [Aminobacter sp. SR38]QOF71431.1 hypothetical protein IG197_27415 [Aminobacter sp. SR38]
MGELPLFTIVKDILLFGIAAYGALLSTFNWRQAKDRDRRKVLVKAGTTMLTYTNGQLGAPFARIEGINVGHRPVTITTLAFELPNKARLVATSLDNLTGMDDTRLPAKLSDGESARLHMSYADIAGSLSRAGHTGKVKIFPVADDSAGTSYRGDVWVVDIEEFRQMAL